MTQLSKAASTCEAKWKMWLLKVFALICLTSVRAAQGGETAPTQTAPQPTTNFVPPVPVLQLKSGHQSIFTTERVELSCNLAGSSDWTLKWKRNGEQLQRSSELAFSSDGSVLTISPKTTTHSGSYSCIGQHRTRAGVLTPDSSSLQITIKDRPIPKLERVTTWSDVFKTESVEFSCRVNSADWTIKWFKDLEELVKEGPSLKIQSAAEGDKGQYSCKAQLKSRVVISEFSNTADITVYDKPVPTMSRSSNLDPMYPGESITFTCSVSMSSGWEYVWYHEGAEVQVSNTYKITVDHSKGGEYHCKARRGEVPFYTDQSISASIKVADPPKPTLTLQSLWSDMFITESVEFSCDVNSVVWTIKWYKDQKEIINKEPSLQIWSATTVDRGQYSCKAQLESRGVISGFSNTADITVYGNKPKPKLQRSSNFDLMYPGESITFTCNVSESSGWEYVWYHKGAEVQVSRTYQIPIDHSKGGEYYCKARRGKGPFYTDQSISASIKVAEPPKPSLKLQSRWQDVFQQEVLEFLCEGNGADWTFSWHIFQNGPQQKPKLIPNEEGSMLNIPSVTKSDEGQYACKAHLKSRGVTSEISSLVDIKVYDSIPTPKLTKSPAFEPMYIGETVKFHCSIDVSSDWEYQWYKDENRLPNKTKEISIKLGLADGGEYSCKGSRGQRTSTAHSKKSKLDVKEIPVPLLKTVTQWLDVFPTEKVELSCAMQGSSGWTFTWYRDDKVVTASDNVLFENKGHKLSINRASISHRGSYSCSGRLVDRPVTSIQSSKVTLHVYDTSPTVTLMQNPEYSLMHTGDSVSFLCHVSASSGWSYLWYKDGPKLQSTEAGKHHNISSVATANSGSYVCQVERADFASGKSKAVNLTVEVRPRAKIELLTGWSEAFSTDSLSLKCELMDSQENWNYTWFKEGEQIDLQMSEKHLVTPQNDPDQSRYTCQGVRSGRPAYSVASDHFKTHNLLLKRRILLSISGCLFFGIIAVFLGCIALRIFRRPAAADEKPEEANLFLTMAQLKDCSDAPSPLVEYITEADLNAPQNEGEEENGKLCSETTPLTTTAQEEQAVTTDSHGATENGCGMVSFKH